MRSPAASLSGEIHQRPVAKRFANLLGLVLVGAVIHPVFAQNALALNLPSAPAPAFSPSLAAGAPGVMFPSSQPANQRRSRWRSPMALSLYALTAGEAFDMVETHRVLSHPQWLCGYNPQLTGITITAQNESSLPASVTQVCASSSAGQAPDYAFEGSFQEDGWTSQLHLAGPRNFTAVVSWNVSLDASEVIVPFLFRHRLPPRTTLAPELTNLAHAAAHIYGGFTNLNYLRGAAGSPNTYLNSAPQLNSLYPGPRWWGTQ